MLLRPGAIPTGDGWAFELKYDGFRAIVSDGGRSPRPQPPDDAGAPQWPLVVERVLQGNTAIRITFVPFDLLRVDGHDVTVNPWTQRRALLEGIWVDRGCAQLADVFDDGYVLFEAVVEHGLEGIVAKRRNGISRPGFRGWTKVKNPNYGRRESEIAHMRRSRERRAGAAST